MFKYIYILFTQLDWRFYVTLILIMCAAIFLPAKYLKLFRSVRFNIWLFLALALASAVGSFLYPEPNLYRTWWFCGMLALMTFDVIVCKLLRFPTSVFEKFKKRRHTPPLNSSTVLKLATLKAELQSKLSFDLAQSAVQKFFKEKKFKVKTITDIPVPKSVKKKAVVVLASVQGIQKWGDFILHICIVIILAGGLIGAMYGFEEVLLIPEKTSYIMQNRNYEVELKDFQIEYYESTGAPSLYASDLVVRENGKVVGEKRIVVNEPLDIHRVRFYQASWGMTDDFHNARVHMAGKVVNLKPRQIFDLEGTPLSIRANIFYPTFDINDKRQAFTRDSKGSNPALQIDFLKKEELQARIWILRDQPGVAFKVDQGQVSPTAPPPFFLVDVDPVLFSGVQVGYDPGAPIFWTGAIVFVLGLCLHFYLHRRHLEVVLIPMSQGTKVIVGGRNSRTKSDFENEFENWTDELKEILKCA